MCMPEALGGMFATKYGFSGLAGECGEPGGCGVREWGDKWGGCGRPCAAQEGAESGACQGTLEVLCGCWAHHRALPASIQPLLLGASPMQCLFRQSTYDSQLTAGCQYRRLFAPQTVPGRTNAVESCARELC